MRQSLADMLAAASYFRNLLPDIACIYFPTPMARLGWKIDTCADISLFTREMRKADMIDVNDDDILLVCCASLHYIVCCTLLLNA